MARTKAQAQNLSRKHTAGKTPHYNPPQKKSAPPSDADVKPKKAHRWRPGTVALREIRKYQQATGFLLPKLPFQRLVREIAQDVKTNVRFTKGALEAVQEASEAYMVSILTDAYEITLANKPRVTLMPKDLLLARRIRGDRE